MEFTWEMSSPSIRQSVIAVTLGTSWTLLGGTHSTAPKMARGIRPNLPVKVKHSRKMRLHNTQQISSQLFKGLTWWKLGNDFSKINKYNNVKRFYSCYSVVMNK